MPGLRRSLLPAGVPLLLLAWGGSVLLHGSMVVPFLIKEPEAPPIGDPVEIAMESLPQEEPATEPLEIPAQVLADAPREATQAEPPAADAPPPVNAEPVPPQAVATAEPPPLVTAEPPPPVAVEPPPPETAEPPPEPLKAELPPDPTMVAEPDQVMAMPPPPPPPPPAPRPTPRPAPPRPQTVQRAPAVAQDAAQAAVTAPSAGPLVAPADSPPPPARPTVAAAPPAGYASSLSRALERHKIYPSSARARRAEGLAVVTITISPTGEVLDWKLDRSTGDPDLDEAVAVMIRRANPLPAPPFDVPGGRYPFTVPVRFGIR